MCSLEDMEKNLSALETVIAYLKEILHKFWWLDSQSKNILDQGFYLKKVGSGVLRRAAVAYFQKLCLY